MSVESIYKTHPQLRGLSARTINVLWRMQLLRRVEIERAIRNRTLHPSNPVAFNFGLSSYREVLTWLGIRLPMTTVQACKVRCQLAAHLREQQLQLVDIALVLRLGSKEQARAAVARGQRLAREAVAA